MVELIFGHDFFGAVWYPAYESFLQVDSFAAALAEALVRVRCGPADKPPAAPPPSTRRASVAASARWRGDSTPSTRRCPCDRAGSMAWRLTKDNAIP